MKALFSLMRRFTIQTRMLGAIAMVVSLLALVGGAGLAGMFRIQGLSRDFVDTSFVESTHMASLYQHFGDVRLKEKVLVIRLFDTAPQIEKNRAEWEESLRITEAELKSLTAGGVGADATRVAGEIQQRLTAYRSAFAPVIANIQASKYDGTATADKDSEKAQEEVRAATAKMDELQKIVLATAQHAQDSVGNSVQTTLWLFGAALIVAVVMVVPLTLLNSASIVRPIREARSIAQAIAGGDLTHQIAAEGHDEASDLLVALRAMQDSLRRLVGQLRESAESIQTASEEVASGNHDLSQRTEQAASSLQQTASSVTQLTGTVAQSADSASQANQLASSASNVAERGGEVVSQVVSTMDEIHTSSRRIADIIGVIDGIAFQTNILALNAAVEAARAGEQGRGFAVVAGEVRSLAQRSAEAAREIKALIGTSVDKVETGSRLVQDAGSTMNEIVASVRRVTDIIGEISAAAREQSGGIGQVNTAVGQLDQMTQQNAALVEESAAAAESLKEQAHKLASIVATFRVADGRVLHTSDLRVPSPAPAVVRPAAVVPAAPAAKASASAKPAAVAKAPVAAPKAEAAPARQAAAELIDRVKQVPPPAPAKPAPASLSASPASPAPAAPRDDGDWETF